MPDQVDKRPGFLPTHQAWWGLDRLLRIQDISSTNSGAIFFTQGWSQQLQHLHTSCNMVAAGKRCSQQQQHVRSSYNMFTATATCSQQLEHVRSSYNMFSATATWSQQLSMFTAIALCFQLAARTSSQQLRHGRNSSTCSQQLHYVHS